MTATVEVNLENAILNVISSLTLGSNCRVSFGCKKNVRLIKWVMDSNFIPQRKIEAVVHERLCTIGREAYEWCVKMSHHPNHIISSEAFGYAIIHRKISDDELSKLSFDHGETKFDYIIMARWLEQDIMHAMRHGLIFWD